MGKTKEPEQSADLNTLQYMEVPGLIPSVQDLKDYDETLLNSVELLSYAVVDG